ncbi:MAG: hypothetical protein NTX26_00370 [Candidatus Parcubacteria bacterium]|nr:hypothetical protein [Candidatus Parcubacteria bacterium]
MPSFPLSDPLGKQTETDNTLVGSGLSEFRGVDFVPSPNSYNTRNAFESLEELLKIPEINYIQLRFFLRQNSLESNEVKPYDEGQDDVLAFLIQRIHKSGKKVSLMPQLYADSGGYVANLKPQDKSLWFKSYSKALLHYTQIAEANNVELFSVGNEMTSIFTDDTEWNKIIDATREVYHGNLTVKLNCWYRDAQFDNLLKIQWLQKLDYIGIAAYFDLTDNLNPTEQDLKKAWVSSRQGLNIVHDLEVLHETYHKPIIFSEIGYRSVDGCNIEPWNADGSSKRDDDEAILCAKALFSTFKPEDWWKGAFWFNWPTGVLTKKDTGYGIRGKPILNEIISEYARRS